MCGRGTESPSGQERSAAAESPPSLYIVQTKLCSRLIHSVVIAVDLLNLAKRQIIAYSSLIFTIGDAWHCLFLVHCFQVSHVFWKYFCLGLISSSFTTPSRPNSSSSSSSASSSASCFQLSKASKTKPGMIVSSILFFSRLWTEEEANIKKERESN